MSAEDSKISAYDKATPSERFKISAIAMQRMRRGKGKDDFDWSVFAALREKVAREQLRKASRLRRVVAGICDKLIRYLIKFRLAVLDD